MKTIARITVAALLPLLALTGCSGSSDTAPASGATAHPAIDYSGDSRGHVLNLVLQEAYPVEFSGVTDAVVTTAAESMCRSLDAGSSFYDAVMTGINVGYSPEAAAYFVGAGIAGFCPEHQNLIP